MKQLLLLILCCFLICELVYATSRSRRLKSRTVFLPEDENVYHRRGNNKFSSLHGKMIQTINKRDDDSGRTSGLTSEESLSAKNVPPVSMILAINNITDPMEFIENFVIPDPSDTNGGGNTSTLKTRVFSLLREKNLTPFAPSATCSPQPTTVPINMGSNPYDVYFPSCTRLDRCGGCCSHELLECAASKSETVEYQVLKTRYLGPPHNKFNGGELVSVELERHLECQCQCRVKENDCLEGIQIYRPNECRCECVNHEEMRFCVGNKFWDPNSCSCRCREYMDCSTGFNFNVDTCVCEARRARKTGFGPGFRSLDYF